MSGMPAIAPYPLPTQGSLPANLADWTASPDRSVLLVHDMQEYFVAPIGDPLRGTLIATVVRLRERCEQLGVPVAFTAQPGDMTDQDRGLLKSFWGPGMRAVRAQRQIVPQLAPQPQSWTFTKWRYSAFFRSGLLDRMRAAGRDQLVLSGVYAHVGILGTALDAFANDIEVFFVADATADFCEADHRLALSYAARCCARVVLADEVFA
jgi:trans-2,3-dihydro-3-hydroxyanthranilic acid synthase